MDKDNETAIRELAIDLADTLERLVRSACPFCDPRHVYDSKLRMIVYRHADNCEGTALLSRACSLGILS